jgi:hypothetical protein
MSIPVKGQPPVMAEGKGRIAEGRSRGCRARLGRSG